jgi:hypothetical protein
VIISFVFGLFIVLFPKFTCYELFAYVISFITALAYVFLFNWIMPVLFGASFTLHQSINILVWNVRLMSLFMAVIIVVILWDLILSLILAILRR